MDSSFRRAIERVKRRAEQAKKTEEKQRKEEEGAAKRCLRDLEKSVKTLNLRLTRLRLEDAYFNASLKGAMHGREHLFVTGDTRSLFDGKTTQNTTILWIIRRADENGGSRINGHGLLLVSNVSEREKGQDPAIRFVMTDYELEVSPGYYRFSSIWHKDMLNPTGVSFADDVKQLSLGDDDKFLDCMVRTLGFVR
jgi:hypothetical protein